MGYGDGLNMYTYVGNNPVNRRDPTGLQEIVVTGSVLTGSIPFYVFSPATFDSYRDPNVPAWFGGEAPLQFKYLDEIVVTARRTRRLGEATINFRLTNSLGDPVEQYFRVDGRFISQLIVPTISFNCGGVPARGADLSAAAAGADAVIHTHPYGTDPFPGPRDFSIPRAWHIPVYGISPSSVWRIDPGPPITVILLSGSWGGFDQGGWTKAANAPARPSNCVRESK